MKELANKIRHRLLNADDDDVEVGGAGDQLMGELEPNTRTEEADRRPRFGEFLIS